MSKNVYVLIESNQIMDYTESKGIRHIWQRQGKGGKVFKVLVDNMDRLEIEEEVIRQGWLVI